MCVGPVAKVLGSQHGFLPNSITLHWGLRDSGLDGIEIRVNVEFDTASLLKKEKKENICKEATVFRILAYLPICRVNYLCS